MARVGLRPIACTGLFDLGGAFRHGYLPKYHGFLTGREVGHRREQHQPAVVVVPGSAQIFAVERNRPAVDIAGDRASACTAPATAPSPA